VQGVESFLSGEIRGEGESIPRKKSTRQRRVAVLEGQTLLVGLSRQFVPFAIEEQLEGSRSGDDYDGGSPNGAGSGCKRRGRAFKSRSLRLGNVSNASSKPA